MVELSKEVTNIGIGVELGSQTGVYRFKSRFGAIDSTYRYFGKIFLKSF